MNLFINTTDSFEDCWLQFFILLKKFWPQFNGKIYLNTENKTFTFPSLNIISLKNGLHQSKWTNCLLSGLMKVPDEYIL